MIAIREAQEGQEGTCLTVAEIVRRVLGESQSFLPGRGRRLPLLSGASSSSVHSHPTGTLGKHYTPSKARLERPAPLDPHQFVSDEVAIGPLLSQEAWARAFAASQDQLSALYQQLIAACQTSELPNHPTRDPRQFVEVTDAREDAPKESS
ncbi:hypothetical protein Tco_1390564 [Tanacetum coccineum]